MKVLLVCNSLKVGGVRTLVTTLRDGLRARGIQVDVLPMRDSQLSPVASLSRVARAILWTRYDAVLSFDAAASVFAQPLAALAGRQVRVAHATAIPSAISRRWRQLERVLGAWGTYGTVVMNSAATITAYADYPRRYRDRIKLIPHGVAPLEIGTGGARARLGIPHDLPLLATAGRLAPQKNYPLAIAALSSLAGVHLAIAGTGADHDDLLAQARKLQVEDRLHLLGDLEPSDLGALIADADAFIFPSVWETFGLSVVEAAMIGTPVVAADLPVLREVLSGDASAQPPTGMVRFHAPGDADALAAAVSALLREPPTLEQRSALAAWTRERHRVDRMIDRYVALF